MGAYEWAVSHTARNVSLGYKLSYSVAPGSEHNSVPVQTCYAELQTHILVAIKQSY